MLSAIAVLLSTLAVVQGSGVFPSALSSGDVTLLYHNEVDRGCLPHVSVPRTG